MKTIILALSLLSSAAYAACENEAMNYIARKYGVTPIDVKDLGGRGGEGSLPNREVWVKASDTSTYSVYFFGNDCRNVTRDVAWGKKN